MTLVYELPGVSNEPVPVPDSPEVEQKLLPPPDPYVVAIHEAGHSVVCCLLDVPFDCVTISPFEEGSVHIDSGLVSTTNSPSRAKGSSESDLRAYGISTIAGEIAHRRVDPSASDVWFEGDRTGLASLKLNDVPSLEVEAQRLVEIFWPIVVAVAEALLGKKKLSGAEVRHIVFTTPVLTASVVI
jgi:hypothetical protein